VAGVFLRGSKVTIRNCWFLGCRSGVSGLTEEWDPERRTNDITIERCDFSLFPTFDDVVDVMNAVQELSAEERQKLPLFYWWQRKQTEFTYELGIALKVGDRWTVRHNRIHQAFDGIGGWGFQKSVGADIYGNVFDHLVDNAIELENHSRDLRFHDNFIRDTFEPFSWQPLAGKPWPGPAWIYRNVVQDTDATKTLWTLLPWERGCFKILVEGQNWKVEAMKDERRDLIEVPPPGVIFSNNTIDFHDGNLFTIGRNPNEIISGIAFVNNLIVARNTVSKRVWKFHTKGMQFAGNYVRLLHPSDPVDVEKCSGNDGAPLPDSVTQLEKPAAGPAAKSLTGVSQYEGAVELAAYAGAIAPGKTYQIPEAGPGTGRR
jgi:hypothetical protein